MAWKRNDSLDQQSMLSTKGHTMSLTNELAKKRKMAMEEKYSTSVYQRLQNRKASSDLNKKPQK